MKKIFSLLAMALSMSFAMTSCDDNDLPDVDINITVSNAEIVDHQMYVVRGDILRIESITVTNNEPDKPAAITSASYYWDGVFQGEAYQAPFAFNIATFKPVDGKLGTPLGAHRLQIYAPVVALDKDLAFALMTYTVNVVESVDDIPADGTNAMTHHVDMHAGEFNRNGAGS